MADVMDDVTPITDDTSSTGVGDAPAGSESATPLTLQQRADITAQDQAAPGPSPAGDNGVIGALAGASPSQLPDVSGTPQRPGYAGKINGQTGQAEPNDPKRPWAAILRGALAGLANSGHAKNFAEGFASGAEGELKQQQIDLANKRANEQLAIQQQREMDDHQVAQAQLATAHIQQQNLVREYNLAPKSTQDILDQISMKAGQDAKNVPGSSVIGTFGTYAEAQQRATVEMKAKTQSALSVQVYHNAQGGFDVIDVPNANKLNESPVDVVVGYDFNTRKPITQTFAPGTISYAQKTQMETNAATKITDASNAFEEYKAKTTFEQNTPQAKAQQGLIASETAKNRAETAQLTSTQNLVDPFGAKIGVTPNGQALDKKEFNTRADKFSKDYVQPINKLAKTQAEFDRINNDPNQTGAEKVTALLAAVGISGDALKGQGFRISTDVINEHAEARNVWQSFVQKWNKVAGSGGPITSQQIADYTKIAEGVVHDSYVNAAQEARRQGLPVDFLPKATSAGQKASDNTLQIYVDAAGGDTAAAEKALRSAGWK